jgi:hypothetical protein
MEPLVAPQRIPPRPPAPPAPPTTDEGDPSGRMPAGNNSLRRTTAVIAAVITAIALLIALLDARTASAIRALFNS